MASNAYSANFDDFATQLLEGDTATMGQEASPSARIESGDAATADLAAVAANTPQHPPAEPVVPSGSIIRQLAPRDFLENPSLLANENISVLRKFSVDLLKVLHVAMGWQWKTPVFNKTSSSLVLAKQIVGYADDNAPPDGSASDTARATAALALQARHFEGGPLAFSMGHIPEFVRTAIAAAPQPVGGKRKDGPVPTKTPPSKKPKAQKLRGSSPRLSGGSGGASSSSGQAS